MKIKNFLLLLIFLASANILFAQQKESEIKAPLEFTHLKHDFGKIRKGIPVTYEFYFTNSSNKTVIIKNATAQCGCTTPVFPKAPVAKGASDKVTVTYNASNPGTFMKQVKVALANYTEPIYLVVSGEVMPSAAQKEK